MRVGEDSGCYLCSALDYDPSTTEHKCYQKAIQNKGFSFVEIVSQCPTHYGRNNRLGDGPAMMKLQKEMSVRVGQAADMSREELQDKLVIGEFANTQRPEYGEILRSFWPESGEGDNA